jgi:hypothetical protein
MPEFDYILTSSQGHEARTLKTSDPVTPKVGYGGHPVGERPRRKSLTVYQGRQPFTLEVPMLLWRDGASVERDRMAIDEMATSEGNLRTQAPPVVQIKASYTLPIPEPLGTEHTARWWIEDLVWGDEIRRQPHEGGYLTRKEVVLTLLEWSAREPVLEGGFGTGTYRVKRGDTILRICRTHGMDSREFRQLNPDVRSDGQLKVGMMVRTVRFKPFRIKPGT